MKRRWIALAAIAAALAASPLAAQMGGYPGFGAGNGPGYGMGPGMMGPYGHGYGAGPGMMRGYGPGYGMGPGMMGAYGADCGPGQGMMWGYGAGSYAGLDLDEQQRAKIAAIQRDMRSKNWSLMGSVQEQRERLAELESSGKADDAAARQAYQALADAHKKMFEAGLDARKRIDEVLTKEQREQLRRGWRG